MPLLPCVSPSSPDSVHPVEPCNLYDEFDIGIVVVIRAPRHVHDFVTHAYVLGVCPKIFGGGHNDKEDGALVPEGVIRPFSDGADALNCADAVVGNKDLVDYFLLAASELRYV